MSSIKYTFFTALGPGRPEALGVWSDTIRRIPSDLTEQCRYIVIVDSKEIDNADVIKVMKECRIPDYAVLYSDPLDGKPGAKEIANHLAGHWRRIKYLLEGLVISLEHDIEANADDFKALISRAESYRKAGVVGCPILGRGRGHLMVYETKSITPKFDIDRKRRVEKKGDYQEVGSVSLGLTAIKSGVAKACQWSGTPNPDGTGGYGHEWSLMRHCHLMGNRVICDWTIRPVHVNGTDRNQWTER